MMLTNVRTISASLLLAVLSFLFVLANVSPAVSQFYRLDRSTLASVEEEIGRFIVDEKVVGCTIALLRSGEVAYIKGFGFSDRELFRPANELTLYRTASVAKMITAVLALRLVEQGLLDLDADIRQYVPSYPDKQQGVITVRDLLTNQSGVRSYEEYDKESIYAYLKEQQRHSALDALQIFQEGSLAFAPGTNYLYSTFGFNLLGAVIEGASGFPYEELLHKEINCRLRLPFLQIEYARNRPYPLETKGYIVSNNTWKPSIDTLEVGWKAPGGGLLATAIDLALFGKGLLEDCIFTDGSWLDSMAVDRPTMSGSRNGYGYGCGVEVRRGKRVISHLGGQGKTRTLLYLSPDNRNGIVILTNTEEAKLYPLARKLFDILDKGRLAGARFVQPRDSIARPRPIFPVGRARVRDGMVTLDWENEELASHYEVQLDTTNTFDEPVFSTITRRSETRVGNIEAKGVYYWRVRARNDYLYDGAFSGWSPPLLFYTSEE